MRSRRENGERWGTEATDAELKQAGIFSRQESFAHFRSQLDAASGIYATSSQGETVFTQRTSQLHQLRAKQGIPYACPGEDEWRLTCHDGQVWRLQGPEISAIASGSAPSVMGAKVPPLGRHMVWDWTDRASHGMTRSIPVTLVSLVNAVEVNGNFGEIEMARLTEEGLCTDCFL